MTYPEALALLDQRQETRIELGLERLSRHLRRMGDPQNAYPAVVVAGTNGKGSVSALLASCLQAAGYRTGLYTSPHLLDPTERIQVDGVPVSKKTFAELISVAVAAEGKGTLYPTPPLEIERREPAGLPPPVHGRRAGVESAVLTYFEILTAAAFEDFRREKVDIAVLEVGLGGRLDATNCAGRPVLSIVTGIHFDHTDWLGDTLAKIAREKAGIFRAGVPALTGETAAEPLASLQKAAKERGAPLQEAPESFRVVRVDWEQGVQVLEGPGAQHYEVALLGTAQARNAALVHEALRLLGTKGFPVSKSAEASGFKKVQWPGRFQVVKTPAVWILDGAHNPQAMQAFRETFDASPWAGQEAAFILGFLKDKDCRAMVRSLAPRLGRVIACTPPSPRALPAEELASLLKAEAPRAQVTVAADLAATFASVCTPIAVVCGSFYLVGAALRQL